MMEGRA